MDKRFKDIAFTSCWRKIYPCSLKGVPLEAKLLTLLLLSPFSSRTRVERAAKPQFLTPTSLRSWSPAKVAAVLKYCDVLSLLLQMSIFSPKVSQFEKLLLKAFRPFDFLSFVFFVISDGLPSKLLHTVSIAWKKYRKVLENIFYRKSERPPVMDSRKTEMQLVRKFFLPSPPETFRKFLMFRVGRD